MSTTKKRWSRLRFDNGKVVTFPPPPKHIKKRLTVYNPYTKKYEKKDKVKKINVNKNDSN